MRAPSTALLLSGLLLLAAAVILLELHVIRQRASWQPPQLTALSPACAANADVARDGAPSGTGPSLPPAPPLRVYMYDLPPRFNRDVVERYWRQKGGRAARRHLAAMEAGGGPMPYPNHQHMAEWYLYSSLLEAGRPGGAPPAATRAAAPEAADVIFVPFFSSLALKLQPGGGGGRAAEGANTSGPLPRAGDLARDLLGWLGGRASWRRAGGRDHVFPCQHPNALAGARGDIWRSVSLLSDFAKHAPREGLLAKDVVLPYVHRVAPLGAAEAEGGGRRRPRPILLFFMGGRHRKDGGSVREGLWRALEGEAGVVLAEGRQTRQGVAAAQAGMRAAQFCLHPAGDTPSGGRLFDAIVSGCIPVVISDDIELPFEDSLDYTKFALFVSMAEAVVPGRLMELVRRNVTAARRDAMRARLAAVQRLFEYERADGAIAMIWRKVASKVPAIREQIHRDRRLVAVESVGRGEL